MRLVHIKRDPAVPWPMFYEQVDTMIRGYVHLWGKGRFYQIEYPQLKDLLPNIARQHDDPAVFRQLADKFAKRFRRDGVWHEQPGTGLNVVANAFHPGGERQLHVINSAYELQAISMNHLTLEFIDVLLRQFPPSEQDHRVYTHHAHEILTIDGCDYSPCTPSDLIGISELCDETNTPGNWIAALSLARPGNIRLTHDSRRVALR
jgi:hypothetical protein